MVGSAFISWKFIILSKILGHALACKCIQREAFRRLTDVASLRHSHAVTSLSRALCALCINASHRAYTSDCGAQYALLPTVFDALSAAPGPL
jgi:hypothetical protein